MMARDSLLPYLFFLVAALFLALFSWNGSLLNHDEITYVTMAREMVRTGNWMDLQYNGAIVHQRPPLAIWLLGFSGAVGDFSLFSVRLPGIVLALANLFLLYRVGTRLTGSRRGGVLSAALLLATFLFYFNARRPMTDMTFLLGQFLFLEAVLGAKAKRQRGGARSPGQRGGAGSAKAWAGPKMWLLAGVGAGWMLMAKSVVTGLPVLAVLGYLLLTPRRRELATRWPWLGVAIAVALAAPWHLAMTVRHGGSFWQEYIGFNVLQRAGSSLFAKPDPLFYLRELWENESVLALLFGAGVIWAVVEVVRQKTVGAHSGAKREAQPSPHAPLFLLCWLVATALPLSLAQTRISHYFLPALPALAVLAARLVAPWLHRPSVYGGSLLLALAFFLLNNTPHLVNPDYSPDQARFAQVIQAVQAQRSDPAAVVAVNHYELALFYYADEPVRMVTDDARFFEIVDSAPILHRVHGVRRVAPEKLVSDLATSPFFALVPPPELPRFCGPDGTQCGDGGRFRVLLGQRLALVTNVELRN